MEPTHTAHTDPHAAPSHEAAHHIDRHVKGYIMVGLTLGACTLLTVGLSYVDFGSIKWNIIVAMIVASIKAGLVALIFMHLKSEKGLIYRFLLITIIFFIGLFALTGLSFSDPIRFHH